MLLDGLLKNITGVFVYYDDVLIASPDIEEHRRTLDRVGDALAAAGMTLNKDKCEFAVPSIQFLGHVISNDFWDRLCLTNDFWDRRCRKYSRRLYVELEVPL